MLRLVATLASLLVGAYAFIPLGLACCSSPSAHSCCAAAADVEEPTARQLDKAPCCTAQSSPQTVRKDEAIGHQVRTPSAAPAIVFVQLALAMPERVPLLSGNAALGPVRPFRPPLSLRI